MLDWVKVFLTLKYVSFDILLLQIFNQLSRRDCYGTMPYVVIMLPRELIVAITEQVFFEICRDASWKSTRKEKNVSYLNNFKGKVECGLLQKINCVNFGSINAQKNKDRLFYANNLALICQGKQTVVDWREFKAIFLQVIEWHQSLIFYTCLYCAEKAQLVIEFTVNRRQLFTGQLLGFLTNAYNSLIS